MSTRNTSRLPKQIYVKREADPNDRATTFLLADTTIDSAEDGDVLGLYVLKSVSVVKITRALRSR